MIHTPNYHRKIEFLYIHELINDFELYVLNGFMPTSKLAVGQAMSGLVRWLRMRNIRYHLVRHKAGHFSLTLARASLACYRVLNVGSEK